MSIELSPSQERRLHSILDRGLEALQDSRDSLNTPAVLNLESNFSSYRESPKKSYSTAKSMDKSTDADELRLLKERLALLEAKVVQKTEVSSQISSKRKDPSSRNRYSPGPSIRHVSQGSSRASSVRNRSAARNDSRERFKHIESSEKELSRLERSITSSPARRKSLGNSRQIEKVRQMVEKERKLGEKLRKENESLRKELSKRDELKGMISKLQDEYNELAQSFERSEAVRKKQKELIQQLKSEIKLMNGNIPDHIPPKGRKTKYHK